MFVFNSSPDSSVYKTKKTTIILGPNEGIEKEFSIIDWIQQCHKNGELNDIDAYVESIISNFGYDCEDFFNPS